MSAVNTRRAQTIAGRVPRLGTDGGHHGAILCSEGGRSKMRPLRRFLKRLSSWARTQQDEERLRAEIEEHLAMHESTSCRIPDRPTLADRKSTRLNSSH